MDNRRLSASLAWLTGPRLCNPSRVGYIALLGIPRKQGRNLWRTQKVYISSERRVIVLCWFLEFTIFRILARSFLYIFRHKIVMIHTFSHCVKNKPSWKCILRKCKIACSLEFRQDGLVFFFQVESYKSRLSIVASLAYAWLNYSFIICRVFYYNVQWEIPRDCPQLRKHKFARSPSPCKTAHLGVQVARLLVSLVNRCYAFS